jgi:hypothetical protein
MTRYAATSVDVTGVDIDHGYGWISFRWPHDIYGHEELNIDLSDGHCSRRMPLHSGTGALAIMELRKDGIILGFDPDLAKRLCLESEIEILFSMPDVEFDRLRRVLDAFVGLP